MFLVYIYIYIYIYIYYTEMKMVTAHRVEGQKFVVVVYFLIKEIIFQNQF